MKWETQRAGGLDQYIAGSICQRAGDGARDENINAAFSGRKRFVDLIGNPVKFSKTPVNYRHAPPSCGQHSEEILEELEQMKLNEIPDRMQETGS